MVESFGSCEDFGKGAQEACGCIEYKGPGEHRCLGWMGNSEEGIWFTDINGVHLSRADFIKKHGNDPLAQKHIQERIKRADYFEIALKEPVV